MLPNSDQGMGILLGAVGLGALLWLAGKAGWISLSFFGFNFQRPRARSHQELEWERQDRLERDRAENRQTEVAFVRYAEAAVGMVPMVSATGPANEILQAWFDVVAGALDAALTKRPDDHFRIAVWGDFGDPEAFALLGCANHNRNDLRIKRLSKQGTIGGHAWRSKAGEYLCADIAKDRRYKSRSGTPRPYKSIFAIRLGDGSSWGVVTIDGSHADGFTVTDLSIIRRFARLVSAGATIAVAKYAPKGPQAGETSTEETTQTMVTSGQRNAGEEKPE
ncbi:MAG TPA: hypothetical protein VGR87_10000 [Candidatus Limnocylindria bacterium]|jgi:hypothetical protein|nr:hypothetical protein [Candidatus Limnocylindria bacterium]